MHHAVPVSVCPGSPAQFYGRIAHLPLHPPFFQHQEDEGEEYCTYSYLTEKINSDMLQ